MIDTTTELTIYHYPDVNNEKITETIKLPTLSRVEWLRHEISLRYVKRYIVFLDGKRSMLQLGDLRKIPKSIVVIAFPFTPAYIVEDFVKSSTIEEALKLRAEI